MLINAIVLLAVVITWGCFLFIQGQCETMLDDREEL